MSIFEEIKEGDRIVVSEHGDWWGNDEQLLKILTVTKVTATQLTAGKMRFMRRNGYEFGKETRRAARIMDNGRYGDNERLMTPAWAEAKNKEIKRQLDHKALAYTLRDTDFRKLPWETLV